MAATEQGGVKLRHRKLVFCGELTLWYGVWSEFAAYGFKLQTTVPVWLHANAR